MKLIRIRQYIIRINLAQMKVDTIHEHVNRINALKNKSRKNHWYKSHKFDLIHKWYNSKNHQLYQNAWYKPSNGREENWYDSENFESNHVHRKSFLTQKEGFYANEKHCLTFKNHMTWRQRVLGALKSF